MAHGLAFSARLPQDSYKAVVIPEQEQDVFTALFGESRLSVHVFLPKAELLNDFMSALSSDPCIVPLQRG